MFIVDLDKMSDKKLEEVKARLNEIEQEIRMGKLATVVTMINDITLEQCRRRVDNVLDESLPMPFLLSDKEVEEVIDADT